MKVGMGLMTVLLVIVLLTTTNCISQSIKSDDIELESCFEKEDLEQISLAVKVFEKKLVEKYKGIVLDEAYVSYLNDFNRMSVQSDFYLNPESRKVTQNLKNSKLFKKVWKKFDPNKTGVSNETEEVVLVEQVEDVNNGEVEYPTTYVFRPQENYITCLLTNVEIEQVKNYLKLQKEIPEVSTRFLSKFLADSLNRQDFNDESIKFIVAFNFYYEIVFLLDA